MFIVVYKTFSHPRELLVLGFTLVFIPKYMLLRMKISLLKTFISVYKVRLEPVRAAFSRKIINLFIFVRFRPNLGDFSKKRERSRFSARETGSARRTGSSRTVSYIDINTIFNYNENVFFLQKKKTFSSIYPY